MKIKPDGTEKGTINLNTSEEAGSSLSLKTLKHRKTLLLCFDLCYLQPHCVCEQIEVRIALPLEYTIFFDFLHRKMAL